MRYYVVAAATIGHMGHNFLTYHSDVPVANGTIVAVQVGKRSSVGVVMNEVLTKPSFVTRPIGDALEAAPLPLHILKLIDWMSAYYGTHTATVLQTVLPRGLGKKRRVVAKNVQPPYRERTHYVLNEDQEAAVTTILQQPIGTTLLRGVTGSGKTAVYIEAAQKVIASGKSVIVLVPEIALTSQLLAEFSNHFDNLILTHSTMTEAERHLAWRRCLTADTPTIVIGPRSALFMPLAKLGLIVVDECHEPSYKQEQAPRYQATRVAGMLGQFAGAAVTLGSATPSVTDTYLAIKSGRPIAVLDKRAVTDVKLPDVSLVDLTKRGHFSRSGFVSTDFIKAAEMTLAAGHQVLVFHNRRGSAPMTLCENCGWTAACPNCYLPLTLHTDAHQLKCHVCGHHESVPPFCPDCKQPDVIHKGIGTKRIAEEMARLFKGKRIARFDADTEVAEQLHNLYQDLYDGKIDIIVGTQVIAKGLDLPRLRLVGVMQADGGLALPDYQSAERVFQLVHQVAGRVGRNQHDSKVIVQTYQPTHPAVVYGLQQNYKDFFEYALSERKRALFPPFTYLLKLTCSYTTEHGAITATRGMAANIRRDFTSDTGHSYQILGPAPSFYERLQGKYRWQLVIKSPSRTTLLAIAASVPGNNWYIDIDPANLL